MNSVQDRTVFVSGGARRCERRSGGDERELAKMDASDTSIALTAVATLSSVWTTGRRTPEDAR